MPRTRRKTPLFLHPAERYPADPRAIFILALSVFSGVGSLLAEAAPGSLAEVVPQWGIVVWGVTLAVGSALALYGLAHDSVTGIIIEQIGSVSVGAACIFYSGIALWVVGGSAGQPVGIILAWGLACFIRWLQLQLLLLKIHQKQQILEAVKTIESDLS